MNLLMKISVLAILQVLATRALADVHLDWRVRRGSSAPLTSSPTVILALLNATAAAFNVAAPALVWS